MRIGAVFFSSGNRERMLGLTRSLARGLESQGHQVDIIDGDHDVQAKLTIYRYLAIGADPSSSFSGKIPDKVQQFLGSSGMVTGKKSFAFVPKNILGSGKALARLMKAMEHEGMFLKNSMVIRSPLEAEQVGKSLSV